MKWTFEQIEGPSADRKTLELDGWNAPFGRPRRGAVMRELIRSRIQTTRYPGAHGQTRHAFGTNWEPFDMHGRWMTKTDGTVADDIATEWTNFVRDERTVRIAWGLLVSFRGYIEELELARESEDEIEWRMKIHIDVREDIEKRVAITPQRKGLSNGDLATVQSWVNLSQKLTPPNTDQMSPDFLDSLDNIAATVNEPAALMNKLAGQMDSFEKAAYSTLQHFRGAIVGFRTALLTFQDVIVNADIDSAMLIRTADDDVQWVQYQANSQDEILQVLMDLANIDRRIQLAQQGTTDPVFITARDRDTWESLSVRATGSSDKASMIRQLAGAKYGERPQPGESYLVT